MNRPVVCSAIVIVAWVGFNALGQQKADLGQPAQFRARPGFSVEEVYPPEKSGSVVAMTFDSGGRLVFSRERGPVLVLLDRDSDGRAEDVTTFTSQVTNCQGLAFDGNDLLAVGEGPDGVGLYRVRDSDGDGAGDGAVMVVRFTRTMAEHGPHAVLFGPDGLWHVVLGNHTGLVPTPDPFSPLKDYIEGQLLPSYGDPRGHAANIRAPGAIIVRLIPEGQRWQMIAGGFRNMYDVAFNLLGELFTLDSDMEWDINLPWYRPVRTNHIVPGGDYGWRTGSGVWPDHYPDSLPTLTDVGRGSPTGVEFYQHRVYPREYYDSFMQADWSRGRILVGFLEKSGATYKEKSEEFVLGEPLNITDLEVGPDGFLYFSKGGRFTEGGIYRVVYAAGRRAPELPSGAARGKSDSQLLDQALSQPQPRSAWSRATLAKIRAELGNDWGKNLVKEIKNPRSDPERRIRALELLQVYGPAPDEELLAGLATDPNWQVRAASTYYLGMRPTISSRRELVGRLKDQDAFVRRRACEALVRTEIHTGLVVPLLPARDLFPLLNDPDRWVRYAARQVLRRVNRNSWREEAFKLDQHPAAAEALLALVESVRGTNDVPYLLQRELELIKAKPRDEDLLGLLRVIHLTIINDEKVDYSKVYEEIGKLLLERFPSRNAALDRELARTLAHLQTSGAIDKILRELGNPQADREHQIHYAYCLRSIQQGWTAEQKEAFIRWFEKTQTQHWKGGASFLGFIENMWNDFLRALLPEEKQAAQKRVPSLTPETVAAGERTRPAFRRATDNQTLSEKELTEYLLWDPMSYLGDIEAGKLSFEKAYCANCHIFGDIGQEAGPNLTDVGKRFQRKDLIDAILYPSETVSDLWAGVEIVTRDGKSVVGTIPREDSNSVTVVTPDGSRIAISKSDIKSRTASKTSLMPDGLLEGLTLKETVDLFAFLEQKTKRRSENEARK